MPSSGMVTSKLPSEYLETSQHERSRRANVYRCRSNRAEGAFRKLWLRRSNTGPALRYTFDKGEMGDFGKLLSMCGSEDMSQRSGICGHFLQLKITKIPESVLPRILGVPGL